MSGTVHPESRPYLLINPVQHYDWGTRGRNALIPKLLGLKPASDKPYAELWIGAHPKAPSKVLLADRTLIPLDHLVREYPEEILGKKTASRFKGQFPFLFKVLSASAPLSIQAHPNKEQAKILHLRDPEHYPDDNHKPEIAIALDGFRALVGFETIPVLRDVLRDYPEIASFAGMKLDSGAYPCICSGEASQNWVQGLVTRLLKRAMEEPHQLSQATRTLANRLKRICPSDLSEKERLFLALMDQYGPGDAGLLFIFLLKMLHLEQGQGVFIDAGVAHAYLLGNIVECMASSDNVVRIGLTSKFKDIKAVMDILSFDSPPVEILESKGEETVYETPAKEFKVSRLSLRKGTKWIEPNLNRPKVMFVVDGTVGLIWSCQGRREEMSLHRGQTLLFPAILDRINVCAKSNCIFFLAEVPEEEN